MSKGNLIARRFVNMHKIMFGCAIRADEPKTFITSSKGFRDELVSSMQRKLTLFFVHIAGPVEDEQDFDTLILWLKKLGASGHGRRGK